MGVGSVPGVDNSGCVGGVICDQDPIRPIGVQVGPDFVEGLAVVGALYKREALGDEIPLNGGHPIRRKVCRGKCEFRIGEIAQSIVLSFTFTLHSPSGLPGGHCFLPHDGFGQRLRGYDWIGKNLQKIPPPPPSPAANSRPQGLTRLKAYPRSTLQAQL